ncbi:MAG: hypothetical protein ACLUEQ_02745 [Cloacibacillus evryensis]
MILPVSLGVVLRRYNKKIIGEGAATRWCLRSSAGSWSPLRMGAKSFTGILKLFS